MLMKNLTTIGKFLLGLMFLVFGVNHFMNASDMTGMVPGWLPGAKFWVYLIGVALVAGGLAVILNKMTYWAGMGLALLMLIFILTIWIPGLMKEGADMMALMPLLLKDMGLMGASLMVAGGAKNG